MATQLKKTVKPSGGDYTSLEACMNANEQNLVTADKYFDVEIDGAWTGNDTTGVLIHNYTTDATRYINVYTTTAARHDGTAAAISGLNTYRTSTNADGVWRIDIYGNYVTIDGIEILGSGGNYPKDGILGRANNSYVTVKNCLIHDIRVDFGGIELYYCRHSSAYNNIIYNITANQSANTVGGISVATDGADQFIYNNTVRNSVRGIVQRAGNLSYALLKNNLCTNNGTFDFGAFTNAATTNNLASDTTAPNYNTYYDSKTIAFVSTGAGTEPTSCINGHRCDKDHGADLSATFTTDIDGVTRTGTWDIGADEYVAAGASDTPLTPTIGSLSMSGVAPRNDRGIIVPTEVDT